MFSAQFFRFGSQQSQPPYRKRIAANTGRPSAKVPPETPSDLALGVLLAGTLGLRQGEVLGLQRRDIELDASPALLHVRRSAKEVSENGHKVSILGETKTPSSKRDIEVPAPLAGKIREHLATYVDKKPTALLFTGVRTRGTIGDYD